MTIDESDPAAATGERSTSPAGWQLEGTSQESYEQNLVPAIFAPSAELLLDVARPTSGERVLDVACGTGIVARLAAARVGPTGTVAAVDVNTGMLAVGRAATADQSPAIEWYEGEAAALPFEAGAFDVVGCQQGLQFFGDQAAALGEMRRVLAPGGRVVISVWRPQEFSPGFGLLTEALERHAGPDAAALMRKPFGSPDREAIRDLVGDAGFDRPRIGIGIITVRFPGAAQLLRQQAASSPLGAHVSGLDPASWLGLLDELRVSFEPYADDDGIAFPMQTWLIRAQRQ
jgi:SAM-dependent methyltransferase